MEQTSGHPSADQLSREEAYWEGSRAGRAAFGASLNPYQDRTPEHDEWERGRANAVAAMLYARSSHR